MSLFFNSGKRSGKVYNSALIGAFFGIFNVFYVFLPYLFSVKENKFLFIFYLVTGILILSSLVFIIICFKNEYSYNLMKLRYLLFTAVYTLSLYLGLGISLFKKLNFSFFSTDTYFMLLYVILSVMSSWDILTSVKKGFAKVKRFYTRTYKKQILYNTVVSLGALAVGIALLLPQLICG